jgi:hypothetical protein
MASRATTLVRSFSDASVRAAVHHSQGISCVAIFISVTTGSGIPSLQTAYYNRSQSGSCGLIRKE